MRLKNISIIGIGKLGLCFALNLEKSGFNVIGFDIDRKYVELIKGKKLLSSEPFVTEYLSVAKQFEATTEFSKVLDNDVIFVIVSTPSLPDGKYDHSQVESVIDRLIQHGYQENTKDLVICCTTMPEYCDSVQKKLEKYNYRVSYNPEFIAQGTIIYNQQYPDMVLIGEADTKAGEILVDIYSKLTRNKPHFARLTRTEAEICKIALNCFLTTKISYANMVGDLLLKSGFDPEDVLNAIGSDSRVGNKYLKWGYGFGGPCFPRDNRAFAIYAEQKGVDPLISVATEKSNAVHLNYYFEEMKKKIGKNDVVCFDYITYKKESTLIVESQQLEIAKLFLESGYQVKISERQEVIKQLLTLFGDKYGSRLQLIEK